MPDQDAFRVTRAWLHQHSTPAGGWTRKQLTALGVPWPPPPGWLTRLVGTTIASDQKQTFERREGEEVDGA